MKPLLSFSWLFHLSCTDYFLALLLVSSLLRSDPLGELLLIMLKCEISSKASAALTIPTTRQKVGTSRSEMVFKRMLSKFILSHIQEARVSFFLKHIEKTQKYKTEK